MKFFEYLKYKIVKTSLLFCRKPLQRQKKYLKKILTYAIQNCEYYHTLDIDVESWEDIDKFPLLSKQIIRENYSGMISKEKDRLLCHVARTGGSTGEPLELLNFPGVDDIFQKKLWKRIGYKRGDVILAMDGTQIREDKLASQEYLTFIANSQLPYGGYALSSLYVNDDNIADYVKEIEILKPAFVRGYPSCVYRIAQYINDNGIKLDFDMKGIELTSESSYQHQYNEMKKAFNCPIYLQYGHTENLVFGYTFDDTMKYRIEPLYGFTEIIRDDGQHAQVGEMGEVVVTTLYNKAMPFIRYRTGDYAVYGGEDERGIVLDTILGRTQDYIINRNSEKVLLTALIFAQHQFNALANKKRWQIEQFEAGKVILHIVKDESYSKDDEDEIIFLFDKYGGVEIIFDYCDNIPLTQRGKSMMLKQHLNI